MLEFNPYLEPQALSGNSGTWRFLADQFEAVSIRVSIIYVMYVILSRYIPCAEVFVASFTSLT
jgi:hypothetical protein